MLYDTQIEYNQILKYYFITIILKLVFTSSSIKEKPVNDTIEKVSCLYLKVRS